MPAGMKPWLNPFEVNSELSKDANRTRQNQKILTQRGGRKLSFASKAWLS